MSTASLWMVAGAVLDSIPDARIRDREDARRRIFDALVRAQHDGSEMGKRSTEQSAAALMRHLIEVANRSQALMVTKEYLMAIAPEWGGA